MGRPTRKRPPTLRDQEDREVVRDDALERLDRFGSGSEFEFLHLAAERVLEPVDADVMSLRSLRLLERMPARDCHVFLYTHLDHLGIDDATLIQRFLAEEWAPPAEREYLTALAVSPRRVWRTRLLADRVVELRDFWTGARRRVTFEEASFVGPLPALLVARVVQEPGPLLYIPPDVWSLPLSCSGELERLAGVAARSGTPWGRQLLAQKLQTVADHLFAEVFHLGERAPFLPEVWRARFRIVADEGLVSRVLPAAGFEFMAGNRWFEAITDRPEAGLIVLRIGSKGVLSVTGSDEMAVRLSAHRLQEMAGRRLRLRQIVEVGDPTYHEPDDPPDPGDPWQAEADAGDDD